VDRRTFRLFGVTILAVVIVVAVAATLAGGRTTDPEAPQGEQVVGVVTSIESEGLTDVRGFVLRTPDERDLAFRIEPGERVLLVDDILTTGGSLLAMLPAIENAGGEIVECAVLVDRSGGKAALTSPVSGRTYALRSLWQLDLPTYEPGRGTCPRCADGTPLHAPGSTGTAATAAAG